MNTKHLAVNQGRNGQVVKNFGAVSPCIWVPVFSLTLIIEAINLGNLSAFVIATQKGHVRWILGFKKQEYREDLEAVVATVYEIPQKDVAGAWDLASCLKELQQVVKLPMYITAHRYRAVHRLHI
eukprot:TRINITY_DN12001_c0_g1_i2.p2 TRINITY_DN12001_c0_g1~~TRINITY_DN12001_c0_g1_i2.p2  ORF type:complete len:125 (-),score=7.18 TRINITY_DN12001_c0_g1_i2:95-469(-)